MDWPPDRSDDSTYREAIDRQIRSWLAEAPPRLAEDAARPFDTDAGRFRGQFLLLGLEAIESDRRDGRSIPAAASVELLYGQALLNARAAGLDTDFEGMDRTRALLASDYLHSLAYAGFEHLEVEPSIGEACFRSVSTATRRLAAFWTRAEEGTLESIDHVPIEPVVTATAGDLAGFLGRADEDCRRALRATGAALGVARWQAGEPGEDRCGCSMGTVIPDDWPGPVLVDGIDAGGVDDLLAPLPDSRALSRLRDVADSVLGEPTGSTHP